MSAPAELTHRFRHANVRAVIGDASTAELLAQTRRDEPDVLRLEAEELSEQPVRVGSDRAIPAGPKVRSFEHYTSIFLPEFSFSLKIFGPIYNIMVLEPCRKVLKASVWEYWNVGVLEY